MNVRRAPIPSPACCSRWFAAPLLAAAAGCAHRVETVSRTVTGVHGAMLAGSVAGFVAAVPPVETDGRCEVRHVAGETRVLLHFAGPGEARRNVALAVDARGTLLRYSDLRGDLREAGGGPRTAITLGFDIGTGTAMNENAAPPATQGVVTAAPAEMLDGANLGPPRAVIEMVRRRCIPDVPVQLEPTITRQPPAP